MAEIPLNLRPVPPLSKAASKPVPTASLLRPWEFDYRPSPDGKDLNLLIMFHGLGDSKASFAKLGRSLNLPCTVVMSLQAPHPIPFLETPEHYSWYNTFDPMFNPLPNPDPSPTTPPLRSLLTALTSKEVGWDLTQIHLFGWGQGGSMALELAYSIGREEIPSTSTGGAQETRRRLGSVVCVCAGLLSHPTTTLDLPTPVLCFTRLPQKSAGAAKSIAAVRRAFKTVEVVQGDAKGGEAMPRDRAEWEGVMRFWSQVLGRDEGWKGEGEVYEVER